MDKSILVKATTTATNPDYERHPHYDRGFLAPINSYQHFAIAYVACGSYLILNGIPKPKMQK